MTVMDPQAEARCLPARTSGTSCTHSGGLNWARRCPSRSRSDGTRRSSPGPAASYYCSLGPQQPAPAAPYVQPRRPFNWRLTGRILFGLAVMWTIGTVIDIVGGYANPAGPVVVSGVLSLFAFSAARRQRD